MGRVGSAGALSLWIVIVVRRRMDFASAPSKAWVSLCEISVTIGVCGVGRVGGGAEEVDCRRRRNVTQEDAAM